MRATLASTVLAGLVGLAVSHPAGYAITIAAGGKARAVVVLGQDAIPAERHAAEELALFLGKVTGGAFPVTGEAAGSPARLLVGPAAAKLADPSFSIDGLGSEGLIIRTAGNDLILAGGRPRGTLYAVYTFLQDQVGCRWWSPAASSMPGRPDLGFDRLDVRFIPRLEYREPFWFSAFDGDWAARNRSNGFTMRLGEQHGGKHVIQGFVHTFNNLVPPGRYFAEHPEWFSEVNGKRQKDNAQLCLASDEMRAELIRNLRAELAKVPLATMASVSQNDCGGYCTCARCAAVDKEEGSPAGSMIRFVNQVAEEIEKTSPGVAISTLAYQYTRKPPLRARPRPSVVVWLCSIECSFSNPLTAPQNAAFRQDIEGWSKICKRLYVWDYTTNFAHYVMPHPNLPVLGPNVRFFVDHSVVGLFEQGAYQSWGSEMMELRAWVLARLLWDPTLDDRKLIDEFIDGYYGPAAPHIRDYLKVSHDAVKASGDPLGCFSPADSKFLSARTLSDGVAHLKLAEAAAAGDPAVLERVRVARLPALYTFITQWDRLRKDAVANGITWPVAESQQAVYDEFMKTAEAIKMTQVSEGRNLDWLKTQLKPGR